jgi:hypothetical protein
LIARRGGSAFLKQIPNPQDDDMLAGSRIILRATKAGKLTLMDGNLFRIIISIAMLESVNHPQKGTLSTIRLPTVDFNIAFLSHKHILCNITMHFNENWSRIEYFDLTHSI